MRVTIDSNKLARFCEQAGGHKNVSATILRSEYYIHSVIKKGNMSQTAYDVMLQCYGSDLDILPDPEPVKPAAPETVFPDYGDPTRDWDVNISFSQDRSIVFADLMMDGRCIKRCYAKILKEQGRNAVPRAISYVMTIISKSTEYITKEGIRNA